MRCARWISRRRARIYPQDKFQYRAEEGEAKPLAVRSEGPDAVCVPLVHRSASPGSAVYRIVSVYNGATPGALQAHLYDQGWVTAFSSRGSSAKSNRLPRVCVTQPWQGEQRLMQG